MLNKKIGFIGIEAYEIIHCLARTLKNMNKKVLLIDISETKSLECTIPFPNELIGKGEIIDYRGIDFSNYIPKENNYEFILIYYGFQGIEESSDCDTLFFITDLQAHNIRRLNQENSCPDKYLIIKNVIPFKIKRDLVTTHLYQLHIEDDKCIMILDDRKDKMCMLHCQWDNRFKFYQISPRLKELVFSILIVTMGLEEKQVNKAYKKAEKGG